MIEFPVYIVPLGRLGNLMFQYMLAWEIRARVRSPCQIFGPGIPEWGITPNVSHSKPQRPYVLTGHLFNLDEAVYAVKSGMADAIVINGWGMRLEYYSDRNALQRSFFKRGGERKLFSDNELLINVRAEDIESGSYRGYYPLPFDFYERIIEETGYRPVFMGQIHEGDYAAALRKRFAQAKFLAAASPMEDFETMRCAHHLAISISSFAWLAAWLSTSAVNIHYPVAGILDPRSGMQNLLPIGDSRYVFWSVPFPQLASRSEVGAAAQWASRPHAVKQLSLPEVQSIAVQGLTVRVPRSTMVRNTPRR